MSKICKTFLYLLCLGHPYLCFANQFSFSDKPWSTGVLINNGAINVSKGELTSFNDFYNQQQTGVQQWGVYSQNVYGISDNWSIQLIPAYNYNVSGGRSVSGWGDFPTILAYQYYRQTAGSDWPSIKFNFTSVFPTGRYQNLDFNNDGFDATGMGTYVVGGIINTEYLSMPIPDHFLDTYFSVGYAYWIPTKISGKSLYGGGTGTNGTIEGSDQLFADLGFEFQVNHWDLIFELYYSFIESGNFKGDPGLDKNGLEATVYRNGTNQWSIAPAIAYNFSANLGIIGGIWLSLNDNQNNKFKSIQVALSLSFPDL